VLRERKSSLQRRYDGEGKLVAGYNIDPPPGALVWFHLAAVDARAGRRRPDNDIVYSMSRSQPPTTLSLITSRTLETPASLAAAAAATTASDARITCDIRHRQRRFNVRRTDSMLDLPHGTKKIKKKNSNKWSK